MIQHGRGKMIQSKIIYFDSVLMYFQDIFLSKLSILSTRKLNHPAMSEKYHFIFQNVKNVWSTVSFCPMENMKHEG